jgi:hypothetical protein
MPDEKWTFKDRICRNCVFSEDKHYNDLAICYANPPKPIEDLCYQQVISARPDVRLNDKACRFFINSHDRDNTQT